MLKRGMRARDGQVDGPNEPERVAREDGRDERAPGGEATLRALGGYGCLSLSVQNRVPRSVASAAAHFAGRGPSSSCGAARGTRKSLIAVNRSGGFWWRDMTIMRVGGQVFRVGSTRSSALLA